MAALHLFVDTNVWLSFFAYSNDDIAQLSKLTDLISNGTLKLYVPEQVAHEFTRNREVKLAESIKEFTKNSIKAAVPRFLIGLPEAKAYDDLLDATLKAKNDLVQKAKDGAISRSFAVDELVANVFAAATIGDVTPEMIDNARLRRDIGNPPGKNNSLGDQINWEYLLATVPQNSTLHVVSRDGDFQSAMKNGHPHHYLCDEWKDVNKGELMLHTELKPFLNAQFAIIQLQVDKEKSAAIKLLVQSGSFATTHYGISMVNAFFDALTKEDAEELLQAGVDNQQIRWIHADDDVKWFYKRLLTTFAGQFSPGLEQKGTNIYLPAEPSPENNTGQSEEEIAKTVELWGGTIAEDADEKDPLF